MTAATRGDALRHPGFVRFQAGRVLVTLALQVQSVAVGWQIYALTGDPLHLGWVGLAQFLPLVVLVLVTGAAADRFDRKGILLGCAGVFALAVGLLAWLSTWDQVPLLGLYAALVVLGTGRAFYGPAASALLPELVPVRDLPAAIAWSSTFWQIATVAGPALGGLTYAATDASTTHALAAALLLAAVPVLAGVRRHAGAPGGRREVTLDGLLAGLHHVRRDPLLMGVITLDLFAVLLGGAVALLPAVARDLLAVGPVGLGMLRGAPAAGAALVALILVRRPFPRRAGITLLGGVAVFGAATVVLGLSRSFPLSLGALVVAGAADMVSVYVRHTLVQLATPDALRGRVSAVSQLCIGASNELGEFESGVTARWWGVPGAIVIGGLASLGVVALWSALFPALRRADRVSDAAQ